MQRFAVIAESAVSKAIGAGAGQAYLDEVQTLADSKLQCSSLIHYRILYIAHVNIENRQLSQYCRTVCLGSKLCLCFYEHSGLDIQVR